MFNARTASIVFSVILIAAGSGYCQNQTVENNWNNFLHYTQIGRPDLAKGYAQALIEGEPNSLQMLTLSEQNPQGSMLLQKLADSSADPELAGLGKTILGIIEHGRFIRRSEPKIIAEEIRRLSTTDRGRLAAVKRLKDAGEYAIPFMLSAMADDSRKQELPNIIWALPQIGRDAIRPLTAGLQTDNTAVKAEIIKALGEIRYPQSLACLKYVAEKDNSQELVKLAQDSISRIDPACLKIPAAKLFYQLAESYYYHSESLAPAEDANFANIWFWDKDSRSLITERVDKKYFYELMTMRNCEWALKADEGFGEAIGLWLAAFFKAESTGIKMPAYFGNAHADAGVYATTAGAEYLHQALARAIKDKNAYIALSAVEALATTAGEKSLMYRLGPAQPLVEALSFNDRTVRYSAAIAIASAGPKQSFPESKVVTALLAEALGQKPEENSFDQQLADSYALRAVTVMLKLAQGRNTVIDLNAAQDALIRATTDPRPGMKQLAGQVLAYLSSPEAQRSIAQMALLESNPPDIRIAAFDSLAVSAKINACLLDDEKIDAIYSLISSGQTELKLRSAAAGAYGSLNLPSRKIKNLILDQARS